ncbi:hypothetical protein PRUPE_1G318600 [Prunus persica]|uniref:Uncharacterized protein n=1 Tax=Prunus persica TaxID=3760 RepID=A0A251R670_PRUPE|nr:hypothetical protein PRUPE_1G318600 [Prunus persica]
MNSFPTDSTHSDDFLGLLLFPFAVCCPVQPFSRLFSCCATPLLAKYMRCGQQGYWPALQWELPLALPLPKTWHANC